MKIRVWRTFAHEEPETTHPNSLHNAEDLSTAPRGRYRGLSGRKIAAKLNIPAGSLFGLIRDLKRAA
jgi:hypothetical protein